MCGQPVSDEVLRTTSMTLNRHHWQLRTSYHCQCLSMHLMFGMVSRSMLFASCLGEMNQHAHSRDYCSSRSNRNIASGLPSPVPTGISLTMGSHFIGIEEISSASSRCIARRYQHTAAHFNHKCASYCHHSTHQLRAKLSSLLCWLQTPLQHGSGYSRCCGAAVGHRALAAAAAIVVAGAIVADRAAVRRSRRKEQKFRRSLVRYSTVVVVLLPRAVKVAKTHGHDCHGSDARSSSNYLRKT